MPETGKYVGAGLLSGFGKGLQRAGEMRFQTERDTADEMRKKSLMSFKSGLDLEAREEQREYTEGEDTKTIKEWRNIGEGMQQAYNKYGEPITDATRPMTAAEAASERTALKELEGPKAKKYDAALNRDAKELLFRDIFRKHSDAIKAKTGKDVKFSDFIIQNEDGTTSFDKTAVTSTFSPELYNELTDKAQLMEEGIRKQNLYPGEALKYTNTEYSTRADKATTEATKAQKEAIAKQYDVPVDDLDALINTPPNAKAVDSLFKLKDTSPEEYAKVMEIAKDLNPSLFDAVAAKHKESGTVAPRSSAEFLKSKGLLPSASTGYDPDEFDINNP